MTRLRWQVSVPVGRHRGALILTGLLFCLATPPPSQGQTAAPSFIVGPPHLYAFDIAGLNTITFTPDNPAALLWTESRLVGGGALRASDFDHLTSDHVSFEGSFAGALYANQQLALGVEGLLLQADPQQTTYAQRLSGVQFSGRVSEFLSWGLAREWEQIETETGLRKVNGVVLGASINIADRFYMGAAMGHEVQKTVERLDESQSDREIRMGGLAYRGQGDVRAYAELGVIHKSNAASPGDPNTNLTVVKGTLQIALGIYLVGIDGASIQQTAHDRISALSADLGVELFDRVRATIRGSRTTYLNTVLEIDREITAVSLNVAVAY